MCFIIMVNQWMNKWMKEWMYEWKNERMNEWGCNAYYDDNSEWIIEIILNRYRYKLNRINNLL